MASFAPSSLVFKVQRGQPELLCPADATPHELKHLSDNDDQEVLRFQMPYILFYKNNKQMEGKDPVKILREAIAKTLVYYYPFAGRLKEGPNRKLAVDCTGEGILFIEANAQVRLEQFGDALQPSFPCLEELMYDITRLLCGGFIFALRMSHTLSDAAGVVQFLNAICELARGACVPSVAPVWSRDILNARDPPCVTCIHRECDDFPDEDTDSSVVPLEDMACRVFLFGPQEVAGLRHHVPPELRKCTMFELLTAHLWRCRTIALSPDPSDEVRVVWGINTRAKFNPPLPKGYYGNVIASPAAVSVASKLCQYPLGYAIQLIREAGSNVSEEYVRSFSDLLVKKGRPNVLPVKGSYLVSDARRAGYEAVDFGWGKAVYGGPAKGDAGGRVPGAASVYTRRKNNKGEDVAVVPIFLPHSAMEIFVKENNNMTWEPKISKI
ncbi:hypothetical protein ACHQM5_027199 [Ranunculus cassubicifolius]